MKRIQVITRTPTADGRTNRVNPVYPPKLRCGGYKNYGMNDIHTVCRNNPKKMWSEIKRLVPDRNIKNASIDNKISCKFQNLDYTLPGKPSEALTAEIDCFSRSVLASGVIKISADKRPLNQLTVKNLFFSLIIKTFCH